MKTYSPKRVRLTYRQILESIRVLPPAQQRRLKRELANLGSVHVVEPTGTPDDMQRGKRMAAKIRKKVSPAMSGSLEETMVRLRGRSWS